MTSANQKHMPAKLNKGNRKTLVKLGVKTLGVERSGKDLSDLRERMICSAKELTAAVCGAKAIRRTVQGAPFLKVSQRRSFHMEGFLARPCTDDLEVRTFYISSFRSPKRLEDARSSMRVADPELNTELVRLRPHDWEEWVHVANVYATSCMVDSFSSKLFWETDESLSLPAGAKNSTLGELYLTDLVAPWNHGQYMTHNEAQQITDAAPQNYGELMELLWGGVFTVMELRKIRRLAEETLAAAAAFGKAGTEVATVENSLETALRHMTTTAEVKEALPELYEAFDQHMKKVYAEGARSIIVYKPVLDARVMWERYSKAA